MIFALDYSDRLDLFYILSQGEHSAILLIFIKLPFVTKVFVLSILNGHLRQVLLYFNFI